MKAQTYFTYVSCALELAGIVLIVFLISKITGVGQVALKRSSFGLHLVLVISQVVAVTFTMTTTSENGNTSMKPWIFLGVVETISQLVLAYICVSFGTAKRFEQYQYKCMQNPTTGQMELFVVRNIETSASSSNFGDFERNNSTLVTDRPSEAELVATHNESINEICTVDEPDNRFEVEAD